MREKLNAILGVEHHFFSYANLVLDISSTLWYVRGLLHSSYGCVVHACSVRDLALDSEGKQIEKNQVPVWGFLRWRLTVLASVSITFP